MVQKTGRAHKVSVYVSEGDTHRGVDTASEILDFLFFRGVLGATVLKGVAGFGSDHHLHTSAIIAVSDHLPVKVEFIETPEKVKELIPKLSELCGSGMIEVQETMIVKAAGPGGSLRSAETPSHKVEGKAKLLRIYLGEDDEWSGKPLYQAVVEALRANGMAGVTVYKGILGYGVHGTVHEPRMFGGGASLMLSVIDREESLSEFMPVLERMITHGLAVMSDVDVISYRYGEGIRAVQGERDGHENV